MNEPDVLVLRLVLEQNLVEIILDDPLVSRHCIDVDRKPSLDVKQPATHFSESVNPSFVPPPPQIQIGKPDGHSLDHLGNVVDHLHDFAQQFVNFLKNEIRGKAPSVPSRMVSTNRFSEDGSFRDGLLDGERDDAGSVSSHDGMAATGKSKHTSTLRNHPEMCIQSDPSGRRLTFPCSKQTRAKYRFLTPFPTAS